MRWRRTGCALRLRVGGRARLVNRPRQRGDGRRIAGHRRRQNLRQIAEHFGASRPDLVPDEGKEAKEGKRGNRGKKAQAAPAPRQDD